MTLQTSNALKQFIIHFEMQHIRHPRADAISNFSSLSLGVEKKKKIQTHSAKKYQFIPSTRTLAWCSFKVSENEQKLNNKHERTVSRC